MANIHIPGEIPVRFIPSSKGGNTFSVVLVLIGLAAFIWTLLHDPREAWAAYVVNWLFFTSVAVGAMAFMAATTIVKARWNWSVRRIALAFVAFLPISFLLLLPMLGLREGYFPWIEAMAHDPLIQKKAAYLNIPFLITRNVLGAVILFGTFLYMAYLYLRPDMGRLKAGAGGSHGSARAAWIERLTQGWRGQEEEEIRSCRRLARLGPASVLIYAVVMSIFAFDWAMSLEPHWFSTIFGAWFFMGALWGGVAATAWLTTWAKTRDPDLNKLMGPQQLHDLGKLSFAFTVFWAYLFFSQYLVIWYGKLPWEQAWVIHRAEAPWGSLSVLTFVLCFLVPFAGLLKMKAKLNPFTLRLFTTVILLGLWMERYLLVFPSLNLGDPMLFRTFREPLIGLLFLGLFLWSVRWFLSTFPVIQLWQPMSEPESFEAEVPREERAGTLSR